MANWKVLGVVPDSDDEDDQDSQPNAFIDSGNHEADTREGSTSEKRLQDANDPCDRKEGGKIIDGSKSIEIISTDPVVAQLPGSHSSNVGIKHSLSASIDINLTASAPPSTTILQENDMDYDPLHYPPEEEISHCYVQITSPKSSPLSSPPASQLSLPPLRKPNTLSTPQEPFETFLDEQLAIDTHLGIDQDPAVPLRRFRARKPIQLHPYVVENEKYRRIIKAGGVAPLRLESSQDDSRRKSRTSASPNPESQEGISQDTDFMVSESQAIDVDSDDPLSSSPPRGMLRGNTETSREAHLDDDDDEFPDIEELLRRKRNPLLKAPKKRTKSYATKQKRYPLSKIQIQRRPAEDIFDVPVSPPTTSSPHVLHSRRARSSISRLSSVSSTIRTPSLPHPNTADSLRKTNLLTPVTSALKPGTLPGLSDTSSDDDAAAIAMQDDRSSSSSSSDESIQIPKNGKKLRGVLPASHLRLDQQKKAHPVTQNRRNNITISPIKGVARRGIALPRIHADEQGRVASVNRGFLFSSDEEEGNDGSEGSGIVRKDDPRFELESNFDQSRVGFAEEDDRIDAMLPSRKRVSVTSEQRHRKKRRVNSDLMTRKASGNRQSRITEHLNFASESNNAGNGSRPKTKSLAGPHGHRGSISRRPQRRNYPRIGILDLADTQEFDTLPNFIKVAARTARQRKGQGRQSPSRKFIRLSTREDTHEVQSILEDWRGGKIHPRTLPTRYLHHDDGLRYPLQPINDNRQQATVPNAASNTWRHTQNDSANSAMPRKLRISRGQQQSMNDYVRRSYDPIHDAHHAIRSIETVATPVRVHHIRGKSHSHQTRFAQLESSEVDYPHQYPVAAFRTTKKALDALYRKSCKRPVPQANIQLSRFLKDDDLVRPSVELPQIDVDFEGTLASCGEKTTNRLKKRLPRRLDANAARYRQPSEPLIMDYITAVQIPTNDNTKLTGLGKLGTRYTHNFDILPLQPGIFFRENTLIGQGLLYQATNDHIPTCRSHTLARTVLKLGEKSFAWGDWNEVVSSEIGICFDWIVEQIFPAMPGVVPSDDNIVGIMVSILEYVKNRTSLTESIVPKDFLGRMLEIVNDFSSRLRVGGGQAQNNPLDSTKQIGVLSICTLLVLQLLQLARATEEISLAWDFEEQLKAVAGSCIDILLAQGLESVRKLYDDLQYLSFRESGIHSDQWVVQGWVILITTLSAAKLPRGTFWDVLNPRLLQSSQEVRDTPTLEKVWYSMFSLLPLFDFDNSGFIGCNRLQKMPFDNWQLPQQLIKRVTSLYASNPKQPPGFNDYCRSLFARCHSLMVHWGWWNCSTIIGYMFDFFASQKLANLRNEEVHVSPQFLGELQMESCLNVAPEDRCFHIFLKMVALSIQHLGQRNDNKAIRNLVARLLPNHNRQYSKDEAIHQKDIASLRNHHDLLCTMFLAAPVDERPAIALIQELVVAGQSHNEACLISLRSWELLARFIVSTSVDKVSYEPLKHWQTAFFSSLCQQYLGQEDEVRQQAANLQRIDGEPMTESRILETVTSNMRSTIVPMCISIVSMGTIVKAAKSDVMVKQALNCDVLCRALDPMVHADQRIAEGLLSDCLHVLDNYMDKIKIMHPAQTAQMNTEYDSQDSLDLSAFASDWERSELILPLRDNVMDIMSLALRKYLDFHSECTKDPMITFRFVECWTQLVSLVIENVIGNDALQLNSFLIRGKHAVFENRHSYKVANNYWPLFLAKLLQNSRSLDDFKSPVFNIGLEWLLCLLKPQPIGWPEQSLSTQLHIKGHYLCSHVDLHTTNRTYMIRGAIRKMSSLLIDKATDSEIGLSQREAKRLFSDMLGEMMRAMQRSLEALEPASQTHKYYVEMVQLIVADIKCYGSEIEPLIEFFIRPSSYYWPPDTDPNLYGAGLVSYCIRLAGQPEKTTWELFYYLHSGWKKALISGSTDNYIGCIKKSIKRWDFCKFILLDFLPAIVDAGFSADGWILCSTFFPPVSNCIAHLLDACSPKSEWAFEHMVNTLKIIMNGIIAQTRRVGGPRTSERGLVAVTIKFWLSIAIPMRQYIERNPDKADTLSEVTDPLTHFIWHALRSFRSSEPEVWYPTGQLDVQRGKYHDKFLKILVQDIRDNWEFVDSVGEKVVIKATRGNEKSSIQSFGWTLKEILEGEIEIYRILFPSMHELPLPQGQDHFVNNLYI